MKIGIDSRSINLHSGTGIGTYTKNLISEMINIKIIPNSFIVLDVIAHFLKENIYQI